MKQWENFVLYGLFWLSCLLYPNPLRDALIMKDGYSIKSLLYVLYYCIVTGLSIHYFLTAGKNPGYVDET